MGEQGRIFDPFNDRAARLVRNELSAALLEGLDSLDYSLLERRARQLEARYPATLYRQYTEERLRRYGAVFAAVAGTPQIGNDIFRLVARLWEQGLFFEVHDVLERQWNKAKGARRKALQGLIQAAGCFLLLEAGNVAGAGKLADKAVANLAANRSEFPAHLRLDDLIENLQKKIRNPPPLD